ncbi:chromosome segregation ATPase [Synechocystis sp. LKSZ1]|uniref:chromosome segregation ATPase n=1 Tax=Synechocystis sp. LKSZ1 TaxID=3144951 RepID=UPI00336BD98F
MSTPSDNLLPPDPTPPKGTMVWLGNFQRLHQSVLSPLQLQAERFPLQFWALLLILVSGGVGFSATNWLLKLPQSPQCSRIFWPIASASMRLYCAQVSAEEKTVDSLLKAIELVAGLPKDHPLAPEINRNIEQWSTEILDLAEDSYQSGNLEEAIATVKRIPNHVQAYDLVESRIQTWQKTWQEGESIYADVEQSLRKSRWNEAFRNAVRLLNLENRYWGTVKYDEAIKNIQIAQEESSKLDSAYNILRRGGIDNWIKAIEEAQKIPKESYAYEEARNLITQAKEKLTEEIQALIDQQDWQTLASTIDRLPEQVFAAADLNDWQLLATAGSEAQSGSLEGFQSAISTAERITDPTRPLYPLVQDLISDWRREETALSQLAKARATAATGTIEALRAAIIEAELIANDNPRYSEARRDIRNWTEQIQITEDEPLLNRAKQLAVSGQVADLEQAIQQARAIGDNRALYNEARREIQTWQTMIQRQQDQPILDQATALANAQNYPAAISTARQITAGRALYRESQSKIQRWQQEIQAQRNLQQAYNLAARRTPEALSRALRLVRQIPSSTQVNLQRVQSINTWSYQLLALAQERASASALNEAIRLAQLIPAESSAYGTAQDLVQEWQSLLAPSAPDPLEAPPPPSLDSNPLP